MDDEATRLRMEMRISMATSGRDALRLMRPLVETTKLPRPLEECFERMYAAETEDECAAAAKEFLLLSEEWL